MDSSPNKGRGRDIINIALIVQPNTITVLIYRQTNMILSYCNYKPSRPNTRNVVAKLATTTTCNPNYMHFQISIQNTTLV